MNTDDDPEKTVDASRLSVSKVGDVAARTGLSPATLYRLANEGKFPRQVKLGEAAAG